ncbi:hypothetical protein H257_06822 [Aphanomyces astaci]|uniref:DDE Tnp4 domain-containing protein n=1 Tax=Aphanomyces astaci TaxID=112090 RepID=W4GL01_APHAT|nr:hypothetical protein H257_06822 [Aphanomyces astaci]ETV79558.1 hypothetical protein H257_06822 [Aphanomyces astaci]|eukprot:XP_009830494.1 hypothetical protein H257_06822 [Aphanomyces astaci]
MRRTSSSSRPIFPPAHLPTGRFGEQKHYFSGKHKLYGFKIEASVSPECLLVDMSPHEAWSVSDLNMFPSRLDQHTQVLAKNDYDDTINDNGDLYREYPTSWAVLGYTGYIGLAALARAIHPEKKPIGGALDRSTWTGARKFLLTVSLSKTSSTGCARFGRCPTRHSSGRFTFALTNFHATLMPLRFEDNDHYCAVMARYKSMAAENTSKTTANQHRCLQRRAE